jgi:hypothetical protein
MENTTSPLTDYLQKMINDHPNTIEFEVATWLLEQEDPKCYLEDLLNHGCVSGLVPDLIYYHDTYAFFDRHYRQISDLRYEYEMVVPAQEDVKNYLAWACFELVAQVIYNSVYYR